MRESLRDSAGRDQIRRGLMIAYVVKKPNSQRLDTLCLNGITPSSRPKEVSSSSTHSRRTVQQKYPQVELRGFDLHRHKQMTSPIGSGRGRARRQHQFGTAWGDGRATAVHVRARGRAHVLAEHGFRSPHGGRRRHQGEGARSRIAPTHKQSRRSIAAIVEAYASAYGRRRRLQQQRRHRRADSIVEVRGARPRQHLRRRSSRAPLTIDTVDFPLNRGARGRLDHQHLVGRVDPLHRRALRHLLCDQAALNHLTRTTAIEYAASASG